MFLVERTLGNDCVQAGERVLDVAHHCKCALRFIVRGVDVQMNVRAVLAEFFEWRPSRDHQSAPRTRATDPRRPLASPSAQRDSCAACIRHSPPNSRTPRRAHAERAHGKRMRFRKSANAHECRCHRNVAAFGKLLEVAGRAAGDDTTAHVQSGREFRSTPLRQREVPVGCSRANLFLDLLQCRTG